jgi:hypothetical protein
LRKNEQKELALKEDDNNKIKPSANSSYKSTRLGFVKMVVLIKEFGYICN